MNIMEVVYVLCGAASTVATFVMMSKVLKVNKDVQEVRRLLMRLLREKQDTDEDLASRLETLQRMRFSYMGRQTNKGRNEK